MLQVMINYVEDQPSELHPPAFPASLLLCLPHYFSAGTALKASRQRVGREAQATEAHSLLGPDDGHRQVHPPSLKKQLAARRARAATIRLPHAQTQLAQDYFIMGRGLES